MRFAVFDNFNTIFILVNGYFRLRFFFLFFLLHLLDFLRLRLFSGRRTASQGEGQQLDGFGVREQRFGMGLDQGFDRHVASSFLVKVCRRW
ncbi:hypothetical protein D3C72_2144110 [compost metagenome]